MKHLKPYKLFEGKQVGNLYHFTDIFSLYDITKKFSNNNPCLFFSRDDFFDNDSFYISTTRKFDFVWGPIRFCLNGTKISNKYKIIPVSYFDKKPNTVKIDPEQFEERIVSNKEEELSLLKYCIRVDICTDPKFDFHSDSDEGFDLASRMEDVYTASEYFTELGIPVVISDKFKPIK